MMGKEQRKRASIDDYNYDVAHDFQQFIDDYHGTEEGEKIRAIKDFILDMFKSTDSLSKLMAMDERQALFTRKLFELVKEIYGQEVDSGEIENIWKSQRTYFLDNVLNAIYSMFSFVRIDQLHTAWLSQLDQCNDSAADSKCEHDQ